MSEHPMELTGRVAISRAGRDEGRAFLIAGTADEQHVLLVDGVLRKLAKPKKKKLKHLRVEPACAESIREKLTEGKPIFDAEIRNCLKSLGYNPEQES